MALAYEGALTVQELLSSTRLLRLAVDKEGCFGGHERFLLVEDRG